MNEYKYILQPFKSSKDRVKCPACGRAHTFAHYIDTTTGEKLAAGVGRCNREVNCGYHYSPKQFFMDNPDSNGERKYNGASTPFNYIEKAIIKNRIDIDESVMCATICMHDQNSFVMFLKTLFSEQTVNSLVDTYKIGSSKGAYYWKSENLSAVFWFINKNWRIRAGQVKLFDESGHTAKYLNRGGEKLSCTSWVHTLIKQDRKRLLPQWVKDYEAYKESGGLIVDCFYGEHLLRDDPYNSLPIAIVEAPKTAIISSVYLPNYTWLAVGSLSYLTTERCAVLSGKHVTLFPDLGAFDKWATKAEELKGIAHFTCSDILENVATDDERQKGLDIADYLIRIPYVTYLKELFKNEFIERANCGESMPADAWGIIWPSYRKRGLTAMQAKEAINELIANDGFWIDKRRIIKQDFEIAA